MANLEAKKNFQKWAVAAARRLIPGRVTSAKVESGPEGERVRVTVKNAGKTETYYVQKKPRKIVSRDPKSGRPDIYSFVYRQERESE